MPHTTPHQFPGKLLDASDAAQYAGPKYGVIPADRAVRPPQRALDRRAADLPALTTEPGSTTFPGDAGGFLKLCQAVAKLGTPAGLAVGRAPSDANSFATGCCGRMAAS